MCSLLNSLLSWLDQILRDTPDCIADLLFDITALIKANNLCVPYSFILATINLQDSLDSFAALHIVDTVVNG